ncbi:MAG TPA: class I SAM-dependent methyltransferase [Rubrivivax sp.]|nr:class I SAM-dependent methyltransferase [Rubrivivax sp.]
MSAEREAEAIAERYARRQALERYSMLRPEVWQSVQERQRAMLRLFARAGLRDLSSLRLLEVGCGAGGNLLEMLRLGFAPQHLSGIELLPERVAMARAVLPAALALSEGDALQAPVAAQSLDIVFVSTVFSSLLDDAYQQRLADAMWAWLKPGGAVLWYDFTLDNPRNPDVRGVPLRRVCELFPGAVTTRQRVTLAPPLARTVCRWHPGLYGVFNALPWLRTHLLAWLEKPPSAQMHSNAEMA